MKSDTKKITTVYTKTFNANIVSKMMKNKKNQGGKSPLAHPLGTEE